MIKIKSETNYLMDWDDPKDRINYFNNLRKFLTDIDDCLEYYTTREDGFEAGTGYIRQIVRDIFKRWNVYFIDIPGDPMPRVNLDEPK